MSSTIRGTGRATAVEMLLLRDRLGLRKYRKTARRDPEKRRLLLELGLDRIRKAEDGNFISLGYRKRRFYTPAA